MASFLSWCGGLLLLGFFGGCGPVEQRADAALPPVDPPEAHYLAQYSSGQHDSTQTQLILRPDSTFTLQITPPKGSADQVYSGKLTTTDKQYQLFFPDTIAHFNELITPVHADASVVAYPDYSVVLDKKLRQLYVRNNLLTTDSTGQP
ncbi:MAG: hypothetical protein WA960_20420 [Tunicatimonas sp.]